MVETEITTISVKGQVVIPQTLRKKLKLKPKMKLLVFGEGDTIIMKKLQFPDLREEWENIKLMIEERNKKYNPLTEEDVKREVDAFKRESRH